MPVTISIPVKHHVKKYVVNRYGLEHQVSRKSAIGLLIIEMLDMSVEKPSIITIDQKYNYPIIISDKTFNTKGFSMKCNKRKLIGICFEKLFLEDLRGFVDVQMAIGKSTAMESIRVFLEFHKITENDIKLDSVYRSYQRYCKESISSKKNILRN